MWRRERQTCVSGIICNEAWHTAVKQLPLRLFSLKRVDLEFHSWSLKSHLSWCQTSMSPGATSHFEQCGQSLSASSGQIWASYDCVSLSQWEKFNCLVLSEVSARFLGWTWVYDGLWASNFNEWRNSCIFVSTNLNGSRLFWCKGGRYLTWFLGHSRNIRPKRSARNLLLKSRADVQLQLQVGGHGWTWQYSDWWWT